MKVIKYEKESVLVQDGKVTSWVDIWIENKDVICEWNQNLFIETVTIDIKLKKWQDKVENFENATNLAIETLVTANIIYQDENGNWFNR